MICSVYISLCLALSPLVFLTQEVYFKKHKFNTVPNVQLKNVERSVEQQVLVSVSVSVSVLVCVRTLCICSYRLTDVHSLKKDPYEVEVQKLLK